MITVDRLYVRYDDTNIFGLYCVKVRIYVLVKTDKVKFKEKKEF